jgi:hypothetical protein
MRAAAEGYWRLAKERWFLDAATIYRAATHQSREGRIGRELRRRLEAGGDRGRKAGSPRRAAIRRESGSRDTLRILVHWLIQMVHRDTVWSCPDLYGASTETIEAVPASVDGRDEPGHDDVNLVFASEH